MGDSAGGNACLASVINITSYVEPQYRLPPPAGIVLLSPWVDPNVPGKANDRGDRPDSWLTYVVNDPATAGWRAYSDPARNIGHGFIPTQGLNAAARAYASKLRRGIYYVGQGYNRTKEPWRTKIRADDPSSFIPPLYDTVSFSSAEEAAAWATQASPINASQEQLAQLRPNSVFVSYGLGSDANDREPWNHKPVSGEMIAGSVSELVHKLLATTAHGTRSPVLDRSNIVAGPAMGHVYSVRARSVELPCARLPLACCIRALRSSDPRSPCVLPLCASGFRRALCVVYDRAAMATGRPVSF